MTGSNHSSTQRSKLSTGRSADRETGAGRDDRYAQRSILNECILR